MERQHTIQLKKEKTLIQRTERNIKHYLNAGSGSKREHIDKMQPIK
jgi:hypothetical protein